MGSDRPISGNVHQQSRCPPEVYALTRHLLLGMNPTGFVRNMQMMTDDAYEKELTS